jgi:hypothetical protein
VGVPVPPRIVVAVWCESGRRVEGGRSESRSSEIVGSGPFVLLEGVGVRGTCIYSSVSSSCICHYKLSFFGALGVWE